MTVAHAVMGGASRIVPGHARLAWAECQLIRDGVGKYSTTYPWERALIAEGDEYFVDPIGGSDSNPGLLPSAKLKSVSAAVSKGAGVITIDQGSVVENTLCQLNIPTVSKKLIIRSSGNEKVKLLGCNLGLDWQPHPTLSGVYRAPTTAVTSIRDESVRDSRGLATRYIIAATEADVEGNPGTFYHDGTYVSTTPLDGEPGDHLRVFLDSSRFVFRHGFRQTLKGIELEGFYEQGFRASNSTTFVQLDAIDCAFRYVDSDNNGIRLLGNDSHFKNCIAEGNKKDGFNPHANGGRSANIHTEGCIGRYNGWDNTNINNGLTNHEDGNTLDVGGEFYGNEGPNVSVVGTDPFSVLAGTKAYDSTRAAVKNNFTSGTGDMRILEPDSGSPKDFDSQTSAGGRIVSCGQFLDNTGSGYTHKDSVEAVMAA